MQFSLLLSLLSWTVHFGSLVFLLCRCSVDVFVRIVPCRCYPCCFLFLYLYSVSVFLSVCCLTCVSSLVASHVLLVSMTIAFLSCFLVFVCLLVCFFFHFSMLCCLVDTSCVSRVCFVVCIMLLCYVHHLLCLVFHLMCHFSLVSDSAC